MSLSQAMQVPGRNHVTSVLWSVGGLLWEGMALLSLAHGRWGLALLVHGLCAGSLALAAARGKLALRARSAGCVGAWALSVPVLAPLGLCLVVLPALRKLRAHKPDGVVELELARPKPIAPREPHGASLRELLARMEQDPSQRVQALMSLRHTDLVRAVPLLRMALLDANEDLRLLAYALLERREKELRARVEAGTRELAELHDTDDDNCGRLVVLTQLCSDNWLLVAAGFVSGDSARPTLDAAIDFGERALWLHNDGSLHLLLARVCLLARRPQRARGHLKHAARFGTARSVLAPLYAQAAFLQGRYSEIGTLLRVTRAARVARPEQQTVRALWAGLERV